MTPLLKDIVKLADGQEAADFSYLWAGISAIATQLAHNVYIPFGNGNIYPNLYLMFVGTAGRRKSTAIKHIKKLLTSVGYDNFARDGGTTSAYLDDLSLAQFKNLDFSGGKRIPKVESCIMQDEFSVFIGINNFPFIALLGDLWDKDAVHSHKTKSGGEVNIPCPIVNILGATTPSQFHTIFPPQMSEQGFLSRLIVINIPANKAKLHRPPPSDATTSARVEEGLLAVRKLKGEVVISEPAWDVLGTIYREWSPIPDVRFVHYSTRRYTQLLKLCMIVAASDYRTNVEVNDVILANTILTLTELHMPEALSEYGAHKDSASSSRIVSFVKSKFPNPVTMKEISAALVSELTLSQLPVALQHLLAAEKLINLGGGRYTVKKVHWSTLPESNLVNFELLGSIKNSLF